MVGQQQGRPASLLRWQKGQTTAYYEEAAECFAFPNGLQSKKEEEAMVVEQQQRRPAPLLRWQKGQTTAIFEEAAVCFALSNAL